MISLCTIQIKYIVGINLFSHYFFSFSNFIQYNSVLINTSFTRPVCEKTHIISLSTYFGAKLYSWKSFLTSSSLVSMGMWKTKKLLNLSAYLLKRKYLFNNHNFRCIIRNIVSSFRFRKQFTQSSSQHHQSKKGKYKFEKAIL